MTNARIKELLGRLQDEIKTTDVDEETKSLMQTLDADIHQLLGVENDPNDAESVLERARVLESRFATRHPIAEQFIREIVDTLARMGV
jgi:hypothetical protein